MGKFTSGGKYSKNLCRMRTFRLWWMQQFDILYFITSNNNTFIDTDKDQFCITSAIYHFKHWVWYHAKHITVIFHWIMGGRQMYVGLSRMSKSWVYDDYDYPWSYLPWELEGVEVAVLVSGNKHINIQPSEQTVHVNGTVWCNIKENTVNPFWGAFNFHRYRTLKIWFLANYFILQKVWHQTS